MEEETLTKKERREIAKEEKRKAQEKEESTSKIKRFFILAAVIAAVVYGGYRAWTWINTPVDTPDNVIEVADDEWIKGSKDAELTLIEYGDFQCPACGSYYPLIKEVAKEYENDMRVVYRQYPLVRIHPNAFPAARAAEAAGMQDKFWEMHDKLFENQEAWSAEDNPKETFEGYASELELDIEKFKTDYESSEVEDNISADIYLGNQTGVRSTPTFILNGYIVQFPGSVDGIKQVIQDALDE